MFSDKPVSQTPPVTNGVDPKLPTPTVPTIVVTDHVDSSQPMETQPCETEDKSSAEKSDEPAKLDTVLENKEGSPPSGETETGATEPKEEGENRISPEQSSVENKSAESTEVENKSSAEKPETPSTFISSDPLLQDIAKLANAFKESAAKSNSIPGEISEAPENEAPEMELATSNTAIQEEKIMGLRDDTRPVIDSASVLKDLPTVHDDIVPDSEDKMFSDPEDEPPLDPVLQPDEQEQAGREAPMEVPEQKETDTDTQPFVPQADDKQTVESDMGPAEAATPEPQEVMSAPQEVTSAPQEVTSASQEVTSAIENAAADAVSRLYNQQSHLTPEELAQTSEMQEKSMDEISEVRFIVMSEMILRYYLLLTGFRFKEYEGAGTGK